MSEIIDAHVVENGSVELVPASTAPAGLFRTNDPVEVVEQATRVADALKAVIVAKKLYENIQGKAHVKVEGWQLVGAMLGVTAVVTHTEPVDGGWKATVEARTADGRVIGAADALCTKHEKRGPWKNADDYARLSMAQTRATAKALKGPLGFVVSLAGYQTTPAEEMTFAEPDPTPAAPRNDPPPVLPTGGSMPAAVAAEPKPTVRLASAAQKRKIWAVAKEREVSETELKAIFLKVAGITQSDRLPMAKVDDVLVEIDSYSAGGDA